MKKPINKSFNVSYIFSFSGKTKSDGVKTLTPQIIRDKLIYVLEDLLHEKYIEKYSVEARIDHEKEK